MKERGKGKHPELLYYWDFLLIDIICMQLAYFLSYFIYRSRLQGLWESLYSWEFVALLFCQLLITFWSEPYYKITERGYFIEFSEAARYVTKVMILNIAFMFVVRQIDYLSRVMFALTAIFYFLFSYIGRILRKRAIRNRNASKKASIIVIGSDNNLGEIKDTLVSGETEYSVNKRICLNINDGISEKNQKEIDEIVHDWADAILINTGSRKLDEKIAESFNDSGIKVLTVLAKDSEYTRNFEIDRVKNSVYEGISKKEGKDSFIVSSSELRHIPIKQRAIKRIADIFISLFGCLFTLVLTLFIGPAIYIKSPGPIFFKQTRIGKNGKKFKMYKFRSMYLDAEKRKKEYMEKNQMQGLMFKLEDDPRIIGSEKKDKNGKPKGIGNFIRNTSLDEFPQFFNVLKGDMSIVGTRPPTEDEWSQYNAFYRSRMSIKPGITGLWQVSGRNEITDFDEVVKLDREYIDNWTIAMDVKIFFKTIGVVLTHKGAK